MTIVYELIFFLNFGIKKVADNSLLKDILDSLEDPDTIQLFAAANGLVGYVEVENRLQELEWERHIDKLWQEVVQQLDAPAKRPRMTLDADDQPSTSGQFGGGNEPVEKPYFI